MSDEIIIFLLSIPSKGFKGGTISVTLVDNRGSMIASTEL